MALTICCELFLQKKQRSVHGGAVVSIAESISVVTNAIYFLVDLIVFALGADRRTKHNGKFKIDSTIHHNSRLVGKQLVPLFFQRPD